MHDKQGHKRLVMIGNVDITPSWEFYVTEFHGRTLDEESFESALVDAVTEVEDAIWPRAKAEDHLIACRMCVCAMAETVHRALEDNVTSYSRGRVSETRATPNAMGFSISAAAVCGRYLGNRGILKRGQWL